MKILYFDLAMGAAGDMLTAALLELFEDKTAVLGTLNSLGIPGVRFESSEKTSGGISGTHITVTIDGVTEDEFHEHHDVHHDHPHCSMHKIEHMVEHLNVSDHIKKDVLNIYKILAEAESKAHGVPVSEVHFHEVGTKDAVADITAVCKLIRDISPDRIIASKMCTGFGYVHCAHGILPVPAPATANLIEGLPVFAGEEEGERLTPTGAALVKYFADEFGSVPDIVVNKTGYGIGTKKFHNGNYVRVLLGGEDEEIIELSANLDDMTAEQIGFAIDKLYEAGAVEAFAVPVTMKKSRPGTILTALCSSSLRDSVVKAFFVHTSTIGVREKSVTRYTLDRVTETVDTPYGPVRLKRSFGYGIEKVKFEFDDVAKIAREKNTGISQVLEELNKLHLN